MGWTTVVRAAALAATIALLVPVTGCGAAGVDTTGFRIMVPNKPGSGYDTTARTVAKCFEDSRVLRDVEVFNLPGTDGTVGLQRLIYERGNSQLLMVMGLGLVGAQYTDQSRAVLADTTPIARLVEEPDIVVVPRDSPFQTLDDLVRAWRVDPAHVTLGGGSTRGGPDHLATMLLAKAVTIAPRSVSYHSYDGGGALLAAILSRQVAVGVSGLGEYEPYVRTGDLRVLAVTSRDRVPGLSAPTLREAGVDVVFTNWRGIVAPPGLAPADVARLRGIVDELHGTDAWRQALIRNNWADAYLTGNDFARFLRDESARVEQVLADLGLAGPGGAPTPATATP